MTKQQLQALGEEKITNVLDSVPVEYRSELASKLIEFLQVVIQQVFIDEERHAYELFVRDEVIKFAYGQLEGLSDRVDGAEERLDKYLRKNGIDIPDLTEQECDEEKETEAEINDRQST